MKTLKFINISFLFTLSTFSISSLAEIINCSAIDSNSYQVKNGPEIRVSNRYGKCSFEVVEENNSSRVRRVKFSDEGQISFSHNYDSPVASIGMHYRDYQLFPNNQGLKLEILEEGKFNIINANGGRIKFDRDGSINTDDTTDFKLRIQSIGKNTRSQEQLIEEYDERQKRLRKKYPNFSQVQLYKRPELREIRLKLRAQFRQVTNKTINFEVDFGGYIPLGTSVGSTPGVNVSKKYTFFGADDRRICKNKLPGDKLFSYKVKCADVKPNDLCACPQEYDSRPYCTLAKKDALKFVSQRKIAKDWREIEGYKAKDYSEIYRDLKSDGNCPHLFEHQITED